MKKLMIVNIIIFSFFASCSKIPQNNNVEQYELTVVSGNDQPGIRNELLEKPVVVLVTNRASTPVANAVVRFEVVEGGGMLKPGNSSRITVQTDGEGKAIADWTLGSGITHRIKVSINQQYYCAMPVYITAILTERWINIEFISGTSQIGTNGEYLPDPILVQITDQNKNPLEGISVLFDVTDGGDELNITRARTNNKGHAEMLWKVYQGYNELEASIKDTFYIAHPRLISVFCSYIYRKPVV